MNAFLPKNYEVPKSSGNYMKIDEGENTFRVLSSAIVGWEGWIEDTNDKGEKTRKPVRFRVNDKPVDLRSFDKQKISHFWAFVVYNCDEDKIQILEITQKTIQRAIKSLVDNIKWGDPKGYDITIMREGKEKETKYSVMPNPHSALSDEIKEKYETSKINLEALYDGEDPFASEQDKEANVQYRD